MITRAKANRLQESNAQSLVDATETFIFDCDGVIWKGDSLIEGVPETLEMLRHGEATDLRDEQLDQVSCRLHEEV